MPSSELPLFKRLATFSVGASAGANKAPAEARAVVHGGRRVAPSDRSAMDGAGPTRPAGFWHWMRLHRRYAILLAFVVPALAYVAIFFAYPLVYGFTMSFENLGFIAGSGPFVGLHNYKVEINDPVTRTALMNTAIFLVLSIVFQFSIGLGIASYFNRPFFLAKTLQIPS